MEFCDTADWKSALRGWGARETRLARVETERGQNSSISLTPCFSGVSQKVGRKRLPLLGERAGVRGNCASNGISKQRALVLGPWSFSGCWMLEFGCYLHQDSFQLDHSGWGEGERFGSHRQIHRPVSQKVGRKRLPLLARGLGIAIELLTIPQECVWIFSPWIFSLSSSGGEGWGEEAF
jgi:hypothetical protein